LSDQIYSQTAQEIGRGGFQQQWPGWARHMIESTRQGGHVDISAPRAAQFAALLSNENRRFSINARHQSTREILALEEQVTTYILSLSSFDVETD
jgi:hypothetical protein